MILAPLLILYCFPLFCLPIHIYDLLLPVLLYLLLINLFNPQSYDITQIELSF